MRGRSSVVRRLSIVVVAIVTLVIAVTGLVNHVISNHYALESAREVLRFNSASILSGLEELMMSHNDEGVLELIQDIAEGSQVYQEIRLVSHYSGEVVASRLGEPGLILTEEDDSCAVCHARRKPLDTFGAPLDKVVASPDGTRVLHVITPVPNRAGCETAECHEHVNSGPTLGFLEAKYSLAKIDTLIFDLNVSFVIAVLSAIVLGTMALWIMFRQILGKQVRHMLGGIRAIASDDLSFRFETQRNDEFGLVEESFDRMASRIQTQQTELRDTREYLEGIVENSADIIITVNPNGLIETVNSGAEQALGYHRDELIGKRIELLFANPRERDAAIARLENQDHVANYETRFLTKSNTVRNVLLTLSRLRDRDGVPIGTIGISKDVTNEKQLQQLLIESQTAAAIGQAVTAIQHAIKNMLNTLTGGSYLVRRGMAKNDGARTEEGVAMIDDGISAIRDLSLSMLKYAKNWRLEPELTDFALLVTEASKSIKEKAGEDGIAVHCSIRDELPLVSCDVKLVHMALMDFATNALDACLSKHYKDGETAEIVFSIHLEGADESIAVEVRDNGIGMNEETRASIFEPFFSTKKKWGTGLGLALTSRIVKLHGGEIEVESEPEKGSLFRMTLPVAGMNTNGGEEDGQEGRSNR